MLEKSDVYLFRVGFLILLPYIYVSIKNTYFHKSISQNLTNSPLGSFMPALHRQSQIKELGQGYTHTLCK